MAISRVGKFGLLGELQVAQEGQLDQLRVQGSREGVVVVEARALHRDFHRGRRAEAHHLGDDVAGFEGDLRTGQIAAQGGAESFAQGFAAWRVGLERDLDHGFLRTAGEEVDQVDGIAGGDDADEIAGDGDVVVADLAADGIQRAQHDALGLFDAGAGGGAQAEAQQGRVGVGEEFGRRFRATARRPAAQAVTT